MGGSEDYTAMETSASNMHSNIICTHTHTKTNTHTHIHSHTLNRSFTKRERIVKLHFMVCNFVFLLCT